MSIVYHYTDTARLPWIFKTGELRPGLNAIGGYPSPDFVWASNDPRDDATASMMRGDHYRSGGIRHIRFTLPGRMFFPWSEVPSRYPAWTADHVTRLQNATHVKRARVNPESWWCHDGPLPLDQVIAIDWRSWSSGRWTSLPPYALITDYAPRLGLRIGDLCFFSRQGRGPQGQQAYEVKVIDMPVAGAR